MMALADCRVKLVNFTRNSFRPVVLEGRQVLPSQVFRCVTNVFKESQKTWRDSPIHFNSHRPKMNSLLSAPFRHGQIIATNFLRLGSPRVTAFKFLPPLCRHAGVVIVLGIIDLLRVRFSPTVEAVNSIEGAVNSIEGITRDRHDWQHTDATRVQTPCLYRGCVGRTVGCGRRGCVDVERATGEVAVGGSVVD